MSASMKMHIAIDIHTGRTTARGRSGRWYTQAEIDRAHAARKRPHADPEAVAFADDLDRTDMTDADMEQMLRDELHDCPECRAAMAAGEIPRFFSGEPGVGIKKPKQRRTRRWREQRRGRTN
jgi:hypothetical protein